MWASTGVRRGGMNSDKPNESECEVGAMSGEDVVAADVAGVHDTCRSVALAFLGVTTRLGVLAEGSGTVVSVAAPSACDETPATNDIYPGVC